MLNNPKMFDKMPKNKQSKLLDWIKNNLIPIKTINWKVSSYRLKHIFEKSEGGFYVTNGEFKGAMLKSGFKINNPDNTNWYFNISQKSTCLRGNQDENSNKYQLFTKNPKSI